MPPPEGENKNAKINCKKVIERKPIFQRSGWKRQTDGRRRGRPNVCTMSEDGDRGSGRSVTRAVAFDYGSMGPTASFLDSVREQTLLTNSSSMSGTYSSDADDALSPGSAQRFRNAMRLRMETLLSLAILRRKYRNNIISCVYFLCLFGATPTCVYLLIEWPFFLRMYLTYSKAIHFGVQVVNIIILYLYIATAFNIQSLLNSLNIHPVVGNVFIALCAGLLFASEYVDQVAVYLNVGHFDKYGVFQPSPGKVSKGGTSPDSAFFLLLLFGTIAATFFAIVNTLHYLYYALEYRRNVGNAFNDFGDSDSITFV